MASTRLVRQGQPRDEPHDPPDRRRWRESLGRHPAANHCFRAAVFCVGLIVVAAGATLWVFSTLLTAPLIFAGLWIWSWEFVWAKRLLHRFQAWLGRFWRRVKRRPAKWAIITALGVVSGIAAYWGSYVLGLW
jgi:hypothetical protein